MGWDRATPEEWAEEFEYRAERMLDLYCRTLFDLGYDPVAYDNLDGRIGEIYRGGKYDALCHAAWMCDQAKQYTRQGRRAKAYRWIGMIQGILWMGGVFTINELKTHNALPVEEWERRHAGGASRL